MSQSWGIILLALYLIVVAIGILTNVQIVAVTIIQGCLAIGSAICLLLKK